MSYELLLVAGPAHPDAARRREMAVARAADLLPGARAARRYSTEVAEVALVECDPAGGGTPLFQVDDPTRGVFGVMAHPLDRIDTATLHTYGAERAAVVVTVDDDVVSLHNDGTGFIGAFYEQAGESLYVSTAMSGIFALGRPLSWDEDAVVEYLAMLHPLGDRTLARGICLLPPGTSAEWRAGILNASARSLLEPAATPTPRSTEVAVEEFRAIWPQVMADVVNRTPGSLGVGLSGGLDSRSIATELASNDRVTGFTFGSSRQHEVRSAELVARRLGMRHELWPVTPAHHLRGAVETIQRLDGTHSYAELYESWFGPELHSRFSAVVSGLGGDCLWGSDRAFAAGGPREVAVKIAHRYKPALSSGLRFLRGDLAERASERVAEAIWSTVAPIDRGRPDTSTYWNLGQRQRRWGYALASSVRRLGLTLEAPFLDRRILEFAQAMTPGQRAQGRLHALIQNQVFWRTADVPRGNDGNAPSVLSTLYLTDTESLFRQEAELAARHPAAASRRLLRFSSQRAANQLAKRTGITSPADRVAERRAVFRSAQWLRDQGTYRERTRELIEVATGATPDFIRSATLRAALDHDKAEPHALARAISLCLWGQHWDRLSAAAGSTSGR